LLLCQNLSTVDNKHSIELALFEEIAV
jgi:hypothetical protein